jgi:ABC-type multidrug transport system fused ATPase/permease subunit
MSIIDNICYGAPDAIMQQVEAAFKAANAYEFITMKLPEGFYTLVA